MEAAQALKDEGLRRNYLDKRTDNRAVVQAWLADARAHELPRERVAAHLAGEASLKEPFERLVDTGLRLNELRNAAELAEFLVDEATELSGADRVLLVLDSAQGLQVVGSLLPRGETGQVSARLGEVTPAGGGARYCYAQLLSFHSETLADGRDKRSYPAVLADFVQACDAAGRDLVIDLRQNEGGYISHSTALARALVPAGAHAPGGALLVRATVQNERVYTERSPVVGGGGADDGEPLAPGRIEKPVAARSSTPSRCCAFGPTPKTSMRPRGRHSSSPSSSVAGIDSPRAASARRRPRRSRRSCRCSSARPRPPERPAAGRPARGRFPSERDRRPQSSSR